MKLFKNIKKLGAAATTNYKKVPVWEEKILN
jgi:hypothetical protein